MRTFSRRRFLSLAAALPVIGNLPARFSDSDEAFLEDLSFRAFLFFWEQGDPHSGLVLDRVRTNGTAIPGRSLEVASIGLTGFALTAMCIASERRWINPNQILGRVRTTLRHLAYEQDHVRGWYYHFVNHKSGDRVWNSELSTIDSALLLAGVLTVQQCYSDDGEIFDLTSQIYERVDFEWMLDKRTGLLHMGWLPETGLLRSEWESYDEQAILYILAIGSPTHPIPAECWYRFARPEIEAYGYRFVGLGPLFTHQYSQAWLDLRNRRDGPPFDIDYFQNSVAATYAHRAYCLSLRGIYPSYSDYLWGVSASDSDIGYVVWGNPLSRNNLDGTVVPCAPGGSLMFAPAICLPTLRYMRQHFAQFIYGRYGFADSFNPQSLWVDPDVVGIDVGITLLSAENLRSARVWNWFNRSPDIQRAMDQLFQRY
ncbi:MAG: glucoamylase family protein [Terriglobales bacterium]